MCIQTTSNLEPFHSELESLYHGNFQSIANDIDELLYMLLFVDTEVVEASKVQDVAYNLKVLKDALGKVKEPV